jgi:ribosomal protein L11 methylase PrmA
VVVALDTDSMAAWEARFTARAQQPPCRPLIVAGGAGCLDDENFDIVLCNMISAEFAPILGEIRRVLSSDGVAVFSGILECELRAVHAMMIEHGLEPSSSRTLRGWTSLCARRGGRCS